MKSRYFIIAILALSLFYSCKPKTAEKVNQDSINMALREDFKKVLPHFPNPMDFASYLQSTGAEFTPVFLNDPVNASAYAVKTGKAAINLGVYMYDLSFCIAYGESEMAQQYYDASAYLAQGLGVEKAFLNIIKTRFIDNKEVVDSLKAAFDVLYNTSGNNISYGDDTRKILRTIYIAGFYVEALHSMFGIIENYPKDILPDDARIVILMPVAKAILGQEENIRNLYALLKENVFDQYESKSYTYWFEDLIKTYEKLDIQSKIQNNQGAELLTDTVFLELKEKVEVIRRQMVAKP